MKNAAATEPAQIATGATVRHTVATGETLSGIAARYGVSMGAIREANRLKKDVVWVGQRLRIPSGASSAVKTASATKSKPVAAAPSSGAKKSATVIKHKVARGDTLSAIASQYGVSMKAIQQANNMSSGTVQLGQTLIIPSA